ncbi:ankyrin repeat and SAM domain-containing protein 1A isoform X2 [Drosophila gunungcola]|nr:ankyrin repeat and SAM domain-containing protein 1A isoform X2 [Drosophila gunungcola]XP_052835698.1 ankyrin repeat and SAM domain-containing protein 1A isoform X2 [Drosophila gunungcola]XP_052835699.1 ankyrin repeat and SAM domain-containing protein 1A isoform X2 [Drosophila gunungcola]XP_052835700.1 ankyrin repeat and SAM domain-containing protein 1A isoform X2 [Drosophila gunungcola]
MGKDQEFLEAARNGNISHIEKVLSQKAKRAGPLASLRRGTGVNVQDSGGYSALHHACLNGHEDIVRLLLAHEASPNLPDSRGSSPLHLAAWAGETEIVRLLLTHPYRPASANLQTIEQETPLHCAAQHGHTGALALLLHHDADPNMRNSRGETPLDLAAQYGRLQAVQMLIRAHPELIAHLGTEASERGTPSPSSPASPCRAIFPHTCLHLASRNGHKSVVEVLLSAGVSVNLLTPSGTALHEAALCGKENVVRTLLKAGISLAATDNEGRTALDILREFPPHVTKHIVAVINNFRNQMDTDEGDEVIYRQHSGPPNSGRSQSKHHSQQQQQQPHSNHYHFNSNNHLLNHSHSMQQSGYSKQRLSAGNGGPYNGGKSLDSALQTEDRFYQDLNAHSPLHSQNDMGGGYSVSPSSSLSSFEPASVSPRSRCSTGGLGQPMQMSTFAPAGPPKKPPRRNLSVSPTHAGSGQQFSYSSPSSQSQSQSHGHGHGQSQVRRQPTSDSPYSHQSHGSVGGMSFDETQLRERQRNDRLYASARQSTRSAIAGGMSLSSSNDMLDRQCSSSELNSETSVPNSSGDSPATNSMKRPIPAPRSATTKLSKELLKSAENATLKSYNPNRKLKRNRNSSGANVAAKSNGGDENCEAKQQIPSSPTHYKQPPTPDHPPPSSSQAERTIHERIRPLSQEYKRRSALLQLQAAQQLMIETGSSPSKLLPTLSTPGYDYDDTVTVVPRCPAPSSGSLSSSISCSDHSLSHSTDYVEEFVSDVPFAGLLKGASQQVKEPSEVQLKIQEEGKQQQTLPRVRPPIPSKPSVPEKKFVKPPTTPTNQPAEPNGNSSGEIAIKPPRSPSKSPNKSPGKSPAKSPAKSPGSGHSAARNSLNLLSPFNAEEARKKISEIIENFGSGILNTSITPTHDIELDFEDMEVPNERRELATRLRTAGLLHLERMLFENGYDNYKFVHNVFEEPDIPLLHIPERDAPKLLRFVQSLPPAEFQPQVPLKTQQENKVKGVATLQQWLSTIALPEYLEFFNKHLYNTIESVCGVWDVELQTVLEINKLGHRRRILQSLAYIRQMRDSDSKSQKTPLGENNETNQLTTNGNGTIREAPPRIPANPVNHRNSITGYRKSRPAPPPPAPPARKVAALQIRAPSELLLGLPANLRTTEWRHSALTLLNERINYEVQYLGSTVVKELRGTESTKKSIQKLKSSAEGEGKSGSPLSLGICHRGVEFIDVSSKRTICEHEIQNINCACQDSEDLRHFAYITKEQDLHYCHVFLVQSTDLASEIILTLGQAFEVAYQLALRDGISTTPALLLDNGMLQGEYCGGK